MIGTNAPPVTADRAIREIHQRPGLIPVDINVDLNRLVWMDIEDTRLVESYFFRSTQRFLDKRQTPFRFSTDLEVLDRDDVLAENCYPSGFIYHLGRSGSTLLSRGLARVPAHLVISEAPPHFFIWPLLHGGWRPTIRQEEINLRRFRHLTLAMGRRRRPEYRFHFVKFTTYNVLFIDFIQAAFPDVPSLFLYRHPAEVLVAMGREGPGWRRLKNSEFGAVVAGGNVGELRQLGELSFYARCLGRFMAAALSASTRGLSVANYRLLQRDNLPAFLTALEHQVDARDLLLIQKQFDTYSKDDTDRLRFVPDAADKKRQITPEIEALVRPELIDLYRKLESAPTNLAKRPA